MTYTSRRADEGLPEPLHKPPLQDLNGNLCFFSDGTTWNPYKGSVLAGKALMEPQKMFREGPAPRIVSESSFLRK